jgi:hypothetical protein
VTWAEAAKHCRTLRVSLGAVAFLLIISMFGVIGWHIHDDRRIDAGPLPRVIFAFIALELLAWFSEKLLSRVARKK